MSAAQREPAPGCNPRPVEQSPSADSVAFNVPPTAEQCERVARLRRIEADEVSRKAARELDALIATVYGRPRLDYDPLAQSRELDRRTANDLASRGFDPEYLANLFGLPLKQQATAPERTSAAA